jgi:hypothetical protein
VRERSNPIMIPIQSGRMMIANNAEHAYQSAAPGHGIAVKG